MSLISIRPWGTDTLTLAYSRLGSSREAPPTAPPCFLGPRMWRRQNWNSVSDPGTALPFLDAVPRLAPKPNAW